jgi:hypothetical protein
VSVLEREAAAPKSAAAAILFRGSIQGRYVAAACFAAGWALFWACALQLVSFLPLWAPLGLLFLGLALLPLTAEPH